MLAVRSVALSLGLALLPALLFAPGSCATAPAATSAGGQFGAKLRLRGGEAFAQTAGAQGAAAAGAAGAQGDKKESTAFTKILYKVGPQDNFKTVEVAGSWSNFKSRIPMQKAPNGDWEVITQLPVGYHEVKFVLNEKDWRCHPDLPLSTDKQGFQNNVIHVSDIPGKAPPTGDKGAVVQPATGVFHASQDSISLAREMVKTLEAEKKSAAEKLAKAHSQLVNTMKQELTEALGALDKAKKHVAGFIDQGSTGLAKIKDAGTAKMKEIQAHMSKIRQILDQKEQVALDSISSNMAQRVKIIEGEMSTYTKMSPEIQDLIDGAKLALQSLSRDPQGFVNSAQELIPKIEAMTNKAAQLTAPTDNSSFDHLHLNLTPVGGGEMQ